MAIIPVVTRSASSWASGSDLGAHLLTGQARVQRNAAAAVNHGGGVLAAEQLVIVHHLVDDTRFDQAAEPVAWRRPAQPFPVRTVAGMAEHRSVVHGVPFGGSGDPARPRFGQAHCQAGQGGAGPASQRPGGASTRQVTRVRSHCPPGRGPRCSAVHA